MQFPDNGESANPFDPWQLVDLMNLATESERYWREEELSAVFLHQLAAPVEFDLASLGDARARQVRLLSSAESLLLRSFRDLFEHHIPPVELLSLTKKFAKSSMMDPDAPIPREIAFYLYVVSILVAEVRCRERISDVPEQKLVKGAEWLTQQPWIDQRSKELIAQLLDVYGS
jgi:hypothetical protein